MLRSPSETSTNQEPVWARIIIVAYRSKKHLQKCVDALAVQSFGNFEVRIVNNQCPEKCIDDLKLPDPRFITLDAGSNLGFSGGCNLGAKKAGTDWLITLNPDTIPHENWLQELKIAADSNHEFATLSSTLLSALDPSIVDGFGDVISIYGLAWRGAFGAKTTTLPRNNVEVFGSCGAAAGYKREVFEAIGGFDPEFFCYLEDVDLSFRLQLAGHRCLQVRKAIVEHVGSASSEDNKSFPVYQTYKNNLRVIIRNAPISILGLMICAYCLSQIYILFRNRRDIYTSARLRGLFHALRDIPKAWKSRKAVSKTSTQGISALMPHLVWSPKAVRNLRANYILLE